MECGYVERIIDRTRRRGGASSCGSLPPRVLADWDAPAGQVDLSQFDDELMHEMLGSTRPRVLTLGPLKQKDVPRPYDAAGEDAQRTLFEFAASYFGDADLVTHRGDRTTGHDPHTPLRGDVDEGREEIVLSYTAPAASDTAAAVAEAVVQACGP